MTDYRKWSFIVQRIGLLAVLTPLLMGAALDVGRYNAPMVNDGLLSEPSTEALPPLQFQFSIMNDYALRPITWRRDDNTYQSVIDHRLRTELVGTLGLYNFIDIGVALPFTLLQLGPTSAGLGNLSGAGLDDIRLSPRIQFADERSYGFGGAFTSEITLPTGDDSKFRSNGGVSWRPRLTISYPFRPSIRLIAGFGLLFRPNARIGDLELRDEASLVAGAAYTFSNEGATPMVAIGEVATVFDLQTTSIEGRLGLRMRPTADMLLTAGVGVGLSQGVGTPAIRGLLGIAFAPVANDFDSDGIPDRMDECPYDAEDIDQFQDADGCPDLDNDADDILDINDECPNDAEDYNQFKDEDGCPDAGQTDSDGDGIEDQRDKCPDDPEDLDGFKDEDGCPDLDNDSDGVPDAQDRCPKKKETINGVNDYDGCPDEGDALTEYFESRIDIRETILFRSGKAIIQDRSKLLLDQVALQILSHPLIVVVRIEGHTDSSGPDEDNMFLSQDRADAVRRYLIKKGVPADKLEAEGFGETVPIADNATTIGRTKNRRVDFIIVQEGE